MLTCEVDSAFGAINKCFNKRLQIKEVLVDLIPAIRRLYLLVNSLCYNIIIIITIITNYTIMLIITK